MKIEITGGTLVFKCDQNETDELHRRILEEFQPRIAEACDIEVRMVIKQTRAHIQTIIEEKVNEALSIVLSKIELQEILRDVIVSQTRKTKRKRT